MFVDVIISNDDITTMNYDPLNRFCFMTLVLFYIRDFVGRNLEADQKQNSRTHIILLMEQQKNEEICQMSPNNQ